ncbi:hypothetical protein [Lysinibacillus capsici]|uniref:hypothetical protein n=1 Tax=Lysinibacillus capsici TaxID=2115968 RepID=UPI00289C1D3A|nr:hypothetical protein [Lysinibacillus capsici]
MKHTENLNLKKPDLTDNILISDINENMDALDAAVGELQKGSTSIPDLETEDKTLAGAINEVDKKATTIQQQFNAHLDDDVVHNRFMDGAVKKQISFGFNPVLGCLTATISEVV